MKYVIELELTDYEKVGNEIIKTKRIEKYPRECETDRDFLLKYIKHLHIDEDSPQVISVKEVK